MVKDEFRPDVGRKLFTQHQAELEQGLQQLAYALGSSQKLSRPAEFFQAFISGFWDPFQEACEAGNQQQKEITEKIRSLECQLRQGITPDIEWLAWYNGLSTDEQLAVSAVPADLLVASGIAQSGDIEALGT